MQMETYIRNKHWKHTMKTCFQSTICVSNLESLFPIYEFCFQSKFIVSNVLFCFQSHIHVSNLRILFPIDFDVSNLQCFQCMFPIYISPYIYQLFRCGDKSDKNRQFLGKYVGIIKNRR